MGRRKEKKVTYHKLWLSRHRKVCTYLEEKDYSLFEELKKRLGLYGAEVLRRGIRLPAEGVVKKEKKEERRVEDVVQKYNELQQRYNELLQKYNELLKEVEGLKDIKQQLMYRGYISDVVRCPWCGNKISILWKPHLSYIAVTKEK